MTTTATAPARTSAWIIGPARDVIMAFAWLPFAVAALAVRDNTDQLQTLMIATFVISAAHQPITLPMVYGDRAQLNAHPKLYRYSPFILAALIVIGLNVSFAVVALVAGTWNAAHTLQQRYGIARIYGRKVGQDDGRPDRILLWSWLIAVATWAAASSRLSVDVERLNLSRRNQRGVDYLFDLQPVARIILPFVVVAAAWATWRWVRNEGKGQPNFGKWLYVGATAALMITIVVAPLAGFIAYVGSHAVEYSIIVKHRMDRNRTSKTDTSWVASAVRTRLGSMGAIVLFTLLAMAIMGSIKASSTSIYTVIYLTVGGLHIFYDGFIWKLRTPQLTQNFELSKLNNSK